MQTVILAGGLGTRLAEETDIKPKPMVEIGGHPIIWHIMNIYRFHGYKDFVLALGYKGEIVKEHFLNYRAINSDFTVDLHSGDIAYEATPDLDWKISMLSTGTHTLTGGRVLRLKPYLQDNGTFLLTYGDGVADIDIGALVDFHRSHGKLATVTAVRPPARFGTMRFDGDKVVEFEEKPQTGEGWINGGFFVFEPEVFDYLTDGDMTILETTPLENLALDGQLMAFRHEGFWQCMDTMRDKLRLEELWQSGAAKWRVWK
jgi:glucose-1-phosphate cytidylyltransferase